MTHDPVDQLRDFLKPFVRQLRSLQRRRGRWLVVALIAAFSLAALAPLQLNRLVGKYFADDSGFYFVQKRDVLYTGYTFPIELWLRTDRRNVNAAGAVLKFDPKALEIVSMNTERSFCSLYLENSFDKISGEVRVACGAPQPGFNGESLLVTVLVRPKLTGSTKVTLDPEYSMLLTNGDQPANLAENDLPELSLTITQTF